MRFLPLLLIAACACKAPVEDKSMAAVEAMDYTLVHSPCENVPGQGMDICRFVEGTEISSSWRIVVPSGKHVRGGQVILAYRDMRKTYAVGEGPVVEIPWREFFQTDRWTKDLGGEAEARVVLEWENERGIVVTARALGLARILVLSAEYNVMPLDSGVHAWEGKVKCRAQYSTAGRSAFRCEEDK